MSIPARQSVVVLVALALSLSGTAGVIGAATGAVGTDAGATPQPSPESDCAAEPPADHSDPVSDAVGWENGTWYDEPIAVTQSDGINASEQAAVVDRTTARVEAVRCVEFNESVPVSVVSRDDYREMERNGSISENVTDDLRTFDNAKFEALFLVGESTDSIEVQQRNRGAGVLGFYSPGRERYS